MENRINLLNASEASEQSQELLNQVQKKFGKTFNIFKMMANSSAVFKSYLDFSGALANGKLSAQNQERIALFVSQKNNCQYCLAAHSTIAKGAGLSEQEIMFARKGYSEEEKARTLLEFINAVYESKGSIDDASLNNIKQAGFSDEEILEATAAISLTFLTNLLNNVAQTQVDFPKAQECSVCSCGCSM